MEKPGEIFATKKDEFRVELAALIDAGKYFVEATCQLESDGTCSTPLLRNY